MAWIPSGLQSVISVPLVSTSLLDGIMLLLGFSAYLTCMISQGVFDFTNGL